MKVSPLQLSRYFVTDLHFTVQPKFDPQKELGLTNDDFVIEPGVLCLGENQREWQVSLRVKQQAKPDGNIPYAFSVEVISFFEVADGFPKERIQRMVETNAPSILYGILREVVRDITTRGPYAGLMLPPVSFYSSEGQVLPPK